MWFLFEFWANFNSLQLHVLGLFFPLPRIWIYSKQGSSGKNVCSYEITVHEPGGRATHNASTAGQTECKDLTLRAHPVVPLSVHWLCREESTLSGSTGCTHKAKSLLFRPCILTPLHHYVRHLEGSWLKSCKIQMVFSFVFKDAFYCTNSDNVCSILFGINPF